MIEIKPYKENDLATIQKRSKDFLISDLNINLNAQALNSDTWSLWVGDEIGAIMGANNLWEGVAQVWAVVSDIMIGHGREFTRVTDLLINEHAVHYGIKRFNSLVNEGVEANLKWIKRLNFKPEFVMYKAAPDGNNMVGFVRWMQKPEDI